MALAFCMAHSKLEHDFSLVRRALRLHYTSLVQPDTWTFVAKLFEPKDKNGKLWANLVAEPLLQTAIPRIQTSMGGEITDPEGILKKCYLFL